MSGAPLRPEGDALRVLQVTSADLAGTRFNGRSIAPRLAEFGVRSRMLVWNRGGEDADTRAFLPQAWVRRLNVRLGARERAQSRHATLQRQSYLLAADPWFREADVVHYHVIHDGWFSLDALPFLSRRKPTVWTWHDPWPMTGHCIYPMVCDRWRTGCGACPHLERPFALVEDRSAEMHAWKRDLVARTAVDLVVASRHMEEMAQGSPIAAGKRVHLIPFGIDLSFFRPGDPERVRERLGIRPDRVVLGFRTAGENMFKGADLACEAIQRLPAELPAKLCLLTTHGHGMTLPFVDRHQVLDLGWVTDDSVLRDSYLAADFFVMPSRAEAFGMMAIEAMACGKPVIVTDGTSLPEVTAAPEAGLVVPAEDPNALAGAILRLLRDPAEREARGRAGRAIAEARYDERRYASDLAALYRAVARRGRP